jgi:Spy/CpxP family protein refolding chaperone
MGVRESDVVAAMKLTDEQRQRLRAIKADRAPFWGEQSVEEADQSGIKAALARYNAAAGDAVDAARADLIDRARAVGQRMQEARDQRIAQVMRSVRAVLTPDQWDAARRAAAKAEAMTRPASAPATRATTQGSFVPVTQRPDGVYLAPSVYINSGLYCLQVDFDPYIGRLGGEARPAPGARFLAHEAPAEQLLDGRVRFRYICRRIPLVAEPKDKEAFERAHVLEAGLFHLQGFEHIYHLADKLGLDAKQKKAVADIPSTTTLVGMLPLKDKAVQDNLKSLYIAFHQSKEGPDRESARKSLMDELRAVGDKAEKAYLDARAKQLNDFEAILTPKQREMLQASHGGVSPKDDQRL